MIRVLKQKQIWAKKEFDAHMERCPHAHMPTLKEAIVEFLRQKQLLDESKFKVSRLTNKQTHEHSV